MLRSHRRVGFFVFALCLERLFPRPILMLFFMFLIPFPLCTMPIKFCIEKGDYHVYLNRDLLGHNGPGNTLPCLC
jgi:hypothetical protein